MKTAVYKTKGAAFEALTKCGISGYKGVFFREYSDGFEEYVRVYQLREHTDGWGIYRSTYILWDRPVYMTDAEEALARINHCQNLMDTFIPEQSGWLSASDIKYMHELRRSRIR